MNSQFKTFSHFPGSETFKFNPDYDYSKKYCGHGKPPGLWLSDEENYDGWSQWCLEHEPDWIDLSCEMKFKVCMERILILDTSDKCIKAVDDYGVFDDILDAEMFGLDPKFRIAMKFNLEKIKKDFSGIYIKDFSRLVYENISYFPTLLYGWDCSSAVVWDLSCVELLE